MLHSPEPTGERCLRFEEHSVGRKARFIQTFRCNNLEASIRRFFDSTVNRLSRERFHSVSMNKQSMIDG